VFKRRASNKTAHARIGPKPSLTCRRLNAAGRTRRAPEPVSKPNWATSAEPSRARAEAETAVKQFRTEASERIRLKAALDAAHAERKAAEAHWESNLDTLIELREYVNMLVNEIEHLYTADVGAGSNSGDIDARLRVNLQCAREIYTNRAASEGPLAASLLERRLGVLSRSATPFARNLAAILKLTVPSGVVEWSLIPDP
jgi:hypothetical protein